MSVTGSLRRGLVAGVCAGALTALFAFVVAEPTLDRLIALENSAAAADHEHPAGTPAEHDHGDAVSRDTQRRAGGPVGFILVGAALGALFGLLYAAPRGAGTREGEWQRSLSLGLAAVGVVIVPFLRYPPNPPGVSSADGVDERSRYYLAALLLGISAVALAWRLSAALAARGWELAERQLVAAVCALLLVAAGFAALPAPTETISVPAQLLWDFRLQSLATQLLLLCGIAAVFGLLAERAARASR